MTEAEEAERAGLPRTGLPRTGLPRAGLPGSGLHRSGLYRVGARPPLGDYLRDVWRRREFVYLLARYRLEAETTANRLGLLWVVLKPLLNAGVYGLVFGFVLGTHRDVDDFLAFLVVGVFVFEYFSTCLTTGSRSITANVALVQSLSFPRMALPLSLVTQRLLQFVPMLAIAAAFAVAFGNPPTGQWLLLVPLVALLTVFNAGLALVTARLTVHLRDLSQMMPFISRLFFYTSGIFFSIDQRVPADSTFRRVADAQPVHEFCTLARAVLLQGPQYDVPVRFWWLAALWSFGLLAIGTVFFWSAEERYGSTD